MTLKSAQAGKLLGNVHVPKPVPNLCMSCVQAWTLLVHWSYCLDTPCTLELLGHSFYTTQVLLGHSLYTRATAWAFLVHYTGTTWILLAHYTGTTWVFLVHIQYNIWAFLVHYKDTVSVYSWHTIATCLGIPCQQTSTSLSTTCTLPEVVHLCLIQIVIVNRQLRK